MALRKSQVLLPNVFQTTKNNKFLNATVDQLISEPNLQRVNSFIGRKFAPNFTVGDSYVSEIDQDRQNYQLEPAVVYRAPNKQIENLTGYIDFVNQLRFNNVDTGSHSDLFAQEYYNYSGFVDLDKLVNYGEYFWLPAGPDSVQVFNSVVDMEKDFEVTRRTVAAVDEYSIDNSDNANPTITVARGGKYTFSVQQSGHPFWIQTETGTSGFSSYGSNVSTREIVGVENNGEDNGTITFTVPRADAQNDKRTATQAANPDFATDLVYTDIHNVPYQQFIDTHGGIDVQTEIDGKSIVFVNTTTDETAWDAGGLFDSAGFDDDDETFDPTTTLDMNVRYDVYNIAVNNINGTNIIQLTRSADWPNLQKVKIKQGNKYGNREFFKNASGIPELILPYTAGLDILYYQDATNPNQFGKIQIVEQDSVPAIDVDNDIVGKLTYTSANGVTFTNGLKVQFNSDVTPSKYADKEYYVEGVGQPGGISVTPVEEMITPETYTVSTSDGFDTVAFDTGGYDGTLNAPTTQDYITINRSSPDRNAWSRGNRWFHREVIEKTALYNDYTASVDDNSRAKRPIIEFYQGLELFNMGTSSVAPVTVVDTSQTDALSNVNGTAGYFADGIDLQQDNTIIFTADTDPAVRDKIYRVDYINQDSNIATAVIINLVEIGTVVDGNCVLSTLGANNQGKQFWLDETTWRTAQQKTKINQDPLFDIFDPDHVSFSDTTKYPSSNFAGTKLFSYKRNNNASPDTILNFGLTYKNFSTIGDIVFDNNFDSDRFQYTKSSGNTNVIVRSGHAHQFDILGTRVLYNGWTKVVEPSLQLQVVSYTVTSDELYSYEIGAPIDNSRIKQPLQVFVNGKFAYPTEYTHLVQNGREYVVFTAKRSVDDIITIKFYSTTKAENSFYEVPNNLERNAGNAVFETLTLGQMRNHTVELSHQIKTLSGVAPGKSNIRDLNYRAYPGNILQHSAGLVLPMYLMSHEQANTVESINYVKLEYTKFKNRFLDNINKLDLDLTDPVKCVDDILTHMAGQKTSTFPFYFSDMIPWGTQKSSLNYTIDDATEIEFEFGTQFDLTEISNKGVLVYHTVTSTGVKTQLCEGQDYTFDTTEAKIILTTNNIGVGNIGLAVNDVITIVEYTDTNGSFVPPTPSKLGLYEKTRPRTYIDNTYTNPKTVIEGHDGSIWIGWDDIRDNVVLEFEKRVYNNIKTTYNNTLFDFSEIQPGYFRSTLAEFTETNNIVRSYFGEWSQRNKIRVQLNNTVDANNPFTWNYRNSVYKIDGSRIPGAWRGIYKWFYDTDTPHATPWKMLGLGAKPTWWDARYGEAPYTFGNTVLWEDLRDGKLYSDATGAEFTTLTSRKRPDLMNIIPVDEQGNLRAPAEFLVQDANETNVSDNWAFSDGSPAETAWVRSSEYPYIMQILAANLLPARYGTLMFDTNLFENNSEYSQILQKFKSYRPGLAEFKMHGQSNGSGIHRVEGYNQFISEYLRYNGLSINDNITKINNLELNLCYGVAGFTDKQYLKVIAESVTPSSQSENIFIPDEDVNVFLKKSLPLERVVYSGVKIIRRADGYEIQGYDIENPFFKIIPSRTANNPNEIRVGEQVFFEYQDFENRIINIPYGINIRTKQQVFDFLVSYQRYLLSRGFIFDSTSGTGEKNDFVSAGKEFGFWTEQGWQTDSVIVISPFSQQLTLDRAFATVDDLTLKGALKDANGTAINPKFYDVTRVDNRVEIRIDTENTQLYSVRLNPIQYEHALVFNNTTIFNDIIFQPELGNRHSRLKLVMAKSGNWNGTLHAPGFFINEDKINNWMQYEDYKKGDIVSYQGKTYVAKGSIDGANTFDYTEWTVADNMQTGMIKNLSNKAAQFKNFFEIDNLNLEDGVDKLGKGIIGFNNKDYLQGLGLDDVSQVKFYQGLVKQKGTGSAINKLIDAKLTNLDQDIDYFEEWAFRVGEFGSIDSNQVLEVIVPEDQAQNNPTVVHMFADGDLTSADNMPHFHVQGKDLYKRPNNYNGKVFANRDANTKTLNDLDTAGYARIDDVDFTVFNEQALFNLGARIPELGKGKKIWIATDTTRTWGMRRIDETLTNVTDVESTGNGFLIYTTDGNHGFVEDDYVIVRAVQPIGKVAKVHSVPTPNKFVIQDTTTEAAITGVSIPLYKLSSVRFNQPSDMSSYTPVSGWDNKELVWVDKGTDGKWSVLQNARPWSTTGTKTAGALTANDKHGTSVAINARSTLMVVGAPEQSSGIVTPYLRVEGGSLGESNPISVATIGDSVDSFGASTAIGIDYVAVGAPDTQSGTGAVFVYYVDSAGTFNRRPAIRPSDLSANHKFGQDIAMSGDGRYMFVSASGNDKVYVYALVDIPTTSEVNKTITGAGLPGSYNLEFTPVSIDALNVVDENGKVYLPNKDFTISGTNITPTATVLAGVKVVIRQQDYFAHVGTYTGHDTLSGDNFGFSIDCDYYGRYFVAGAPDSAVANTDSTVLAGAGEAYVFAQVVERFVANGTAKAFTTNADLQAKIFVEIDGVIQIETDNADVGIDNEGSTEGFFTRSGNTITFKFTPESGSNIIVHTGTFAEKQKLDQNVAGQAPGQGEQFGKSVAIDTHGTMVAVGSPGEDETNPNTGSVFIFQDSGKNYARVTTNAIHTQTAGDIFYIDDYRVTLSETGTNPTGLASDINNASIPGVSASVNSAGQVVIDTTKTINKNKLTINPGTGQLFLRDSIIAPFTFTQKINHPNAFENENFGEQVVFDRHISEGGTAEGTRNLLVASDRASTLLGVGFDIEQNSNSQDYLSATTTFDQNGTTFTDRITQSGAAYVYELLDANQESITNPKKMVFGQQLKSTNVSELDQFGSSIAYSDTRIVVGAPQDDTVKGSTTLTNSGSVYEFNNSDRTSSWQVLRNEDSRVDEDQINRIALYNKRNGEISVFLDHINPSKGKIAGVANAELSYISSSDPALYANNNWTYKYEYRLWWDTSTVHYLNAEQGDLDFRTNYWAQTFPGSTINVYEWVSSTVPPEQYAGEGIVKDITKFTTANVYDSKNNATRLKWFFWVQGRRSVPAEADFRTISADSVRSLISDPKAAGLPYVGFLRDDSMALFNCKQYFADSDTVLSVNYDVVKNEGVLHSEYELFGRGNVDQDIPARMYTKLVDSLAGTDSVGNLVPDPFLTDVEKYGVLTQPRQGLFVNRASAIKILVQYCNTIFVQAPFARNSNLARLLSSENIPTVNSGEYNKSVDSVEERDFLNTATLSTGYRVLVLEDENNKNYWSIYSLQADKSWILVDIQGFNTADYWDYATYYKTGYDATTIPKYQVRLEADLLTLTEAEEGDIAKVTSNDEGNFSMFALQSDGTWDEVIIERGTLSLNASLYAFGSLNSNFEATGFDNDGFDFGAFDKVPADEIRQIVEALKTDIFIGDYEINMNELFFRLMEYALNETEFTQDWLFKTSFITVAHKIRSLDQYNTFKYDNTEFIEDFINEVKPYKTKIREYVSKYDKLDLYDSDTTDFDLHPFYDESLGYFRGPSGDFAGDEILQSQGLNKPWYDNYGYRLDSISIVSAGTGYITDPTVTISAPQLAGGVQATAVAKTNGDTIISITMTNKGSGYTSNPTVTITGSGTGVLVSPRLVNNTTRAFDTTIKFDRITYSSSIKDWTKNTAYTAGDVVAYQNTATGTQEVYDCVLSFTSGTTFSVENASGSTVLTVKPDADFTNTADRIAAYYYPSEGMLGDDLEMLQKGTGYMGNRVTGANFNQDPGFDSGNFDTVAFDNFEIDEDGLAVLAGLDTNISSLFTDLALGTRPEDINIDGAGFVDTYNSHAPEELIPGRVYDTLDMEVYTHASHDYEKDGNAPVIKYNSYTDPTGTLTDFSYGDATKSADDFEYIIVYKDTTRVYNFSTNFKSKEVILSSPLGASETLHIYAYSATGEKLVGEYEYTGDGSTVSFVLGNVNTITQQTLVFVDGVETTVTVSSQDNRTLITFGTAPSNGAKVHILAFNQAPGRDAPSKIALQTTTLTSGTLTYSLDNTVNYAQPFSANTVVEIDNVRLRPANSKYHTGDGSTVQFAISDTAGETTISNISDIGVAIIQQSTNTTLNAVRNIDYTVETGDAFITMLSAPADGDKVIVYNNADAEYTISGDGTEITIAGSVSYTSSSVMRVNTFANHDPLRIQTKVHVGQGTGSTTVSDDFDEVPFDSAAFDRIATTGVTGIYSLDRTVTNVNNFWVTVDGQRLHPGDYTVSGTNLIMGNNAKASIIGSTVVVITHISENSIQPSTGFRIFQDMNGNVEYLRLAKDATTTVVEAVNITDERIYVDDVSKLPFATPDSEFPGVVFIGSERIEYRQVSLEDNYITQLRRGTKGTQIYLQIAPGFLVVDGSNDQKLPASDTHTKTWYDLGDGTAADGLGLQQSSTTNANFLKESEAQVPNYRLELNEKLYMDADYVEDDYVEELL